MKVLTVRIPKLLFLIWFLFFLAASISSAAQASAKGGTVKMQVGESKEVNLKEAPRSIDLSQPDIIDVQRVGLSNKILVTALKSGSSLLKAHFSDGEIRLWEFNVGAMALHPSLTANLSSASLLRTGRELQKRTGLEVTVDNGRIALFGSLTNEVQLRALLDLCLEQDECLPRFSLSDAALKSLVAHFKNHVQMMGLQNISVESHLGGLFLKGQLADETQLNALISAAKSIAPRVHHRVRVERASETLVEAQLSFFRISQTGLTSLGITTADPHSSSLSTNLARATVGEQRGKIKGGPLVTLALPEILLRALSQKGAAKQIAQPSIVVASGGRGEILSGGELLFRSEGQVQKFFSQSYGVSIVLQPKLIGDEKVIQKVELKITHPQSDPTQNAISSLNSSLLSTEISSRLNETLLLARLNQRAQGKATSKIPLLGHVPLLGELFKSRELTEEDAELWITLRSSVLLSQPPVLPAQEINTKPASTQPELLD